MTVWTEARRPRAGGMLARRSAARGILARGILARGVLALLPLAAALLPTGLLLSARVHAEPGEAGRPALLAACGRVYDAAACRCAVDQPAIAGAPARPVAVAGPMSAAPPPRVEAGRVPVTLTPDFVRLVQACMAGTGPAD